MAKKRTTATSRQVKAAGRATTEAPSVRFASRAAVRRAYARASRMYALTSKILYEN